MLVDKYQRYIREYSQICRFGNRYQGTPNCGTDGKDKGRYHKFERCILVCEKYDFLPYAIHFKDEGSQFCFTK